jgi:hypothetical protein
MFSLGSVVVGCTVIVRLHVQGTAKEPAARAYSPPGRPDTTLTFGQIKRDLTGDGVPEVLRLTGIGKTIDSLEVTFEIRSSGQLLYTITWPMTRAVGPERNRLLSDAELRAHLAGFGREFFGKSQFKSADVFLTTLHDQAPLHIGQIPEVIARQRRRQQGDSLTTSELTRASAVWEEMRAAKVTAFEFSTGGDTATAIAWSPTDRRFYRLFECC